MKRWLGVLTCGSLLLTAATAAGYWHFGGSLLLTLAITFGTTAYHFCMRLLVGALVCGVMGKRVDVWKWWFRPRTFEEPLYRRLQVRRWKGRMPAYEPSLFSPEVHSWEEIAREMCRAEVTHEVIAVLSFLPLIMAPVFGAFWVFFLTSVAAAGFDLLFVAIQRYNRPRVLRVCARGGFPDRDTKVIEKGRAK